MKKLEVTLEVLETRNLYSIMAIVDKSGTILMDSGGVCSCSSCCSSF